MDDFVLNVRQIGQYPQTTTAAINDVLLIQKNGAGGDYNYIKPLDLFATSLAQEGVLGLATAAIIQWTNGPAISSSAGGINFSSPINAPTVNASSIVAQSVTVGGQEVATVTFVNDLLDQLAGAVVFSVNGRSGNVQLQESDILQAGAAPVINPHFGGVVTAPTIWNPNDKSDTVATTAFVQNAICNALESGHVVLSYNGRGGHVIPIADDVTTACTVFGQWALTNTPPSGDVSKRIANTAFVDDALAVAKDELQHTFAEIADSLDQKYAPLDSPQFVGVPTAPTAAQTVNSGQLATTAFVHAAVTASTTGVSSWNGRTGSVTLQQSDVTAVGAALLASPVFTGVPAGPTAAPGNSSTQLATTAFVQAAIGAIASGVTSFNTRTGAVTLTAADVQAVGGAPIASPVFTGDPRAPTPLPGDNDTSIATTAFVAAAVAALPAPVTSFNGRVGAVTFQASDISAVNGALLASPAFTGVPTGPTATAGTSNQQLATTAFVANAVSGVVAGVSSFNGRSGAVTFAAGDITGVGGALLAGPTFTGVPSAPTATAGTNSTQLATTAFVQAALAAAPGGVSSFNGRTGAITFLASDVSAVGGALLASPAFSGNPTAPTPSPGDNDTSIATTAFVATAIASSGGVNSFNGRAGAVTLTAADIVNATGAIYSQADTAPVNGLNKLWFDSTKGQLFVNYHDPSTSADSWVIANTVPPPPVQQPAPGTLVLLQRQDVTTAVTAVDFTNIPTIYDEYELRFYSVVPVGGDGALSMRVSQDNGATWKNGASDYYYGAAFTNYTVSGSAFTGAGATGLAYFQVTAQLAVAAPTSPAYGRISVNQLSVNGIRKEFLVQSAFYSSTSSLSGWHGWGAYGSDNLPHSGLRFLLSTGSSFKGTFILYGVAK